MEISGYSSMSLVLVNSFLKRLEGFNDHDIILYNEHTVTF